jgi:phosphoribosylformylglycinamidine synthase PurS subunit
MKATVLVRPKPGILDPQGKAVEDSLRHLGFKVDEARVGRLLDLEVEASDPDQARAEVERMCAELLANPLIESYEIELGRPRDRAAPRHRSRRLPGFERRPRRGARARGARRRPGLALACEPELPEVGAVVLPGGFSYGDYLAAGAIARFSPAMRAVADFAANGGFVLGICNGFQILCEAGLLPGVLRPNESLSFVCRDVPVRVERNDVPFLSGCEIGQRLTIPSSTARAATSPMASSSRSSRATARSFSATKERAPTARSTHRGRCQRRRQRDGPDAAPGARGRSAAGSADGAFILQAWSNAPASAYSRGLAV